MPVVHICPHKIFVTFLFEDINTVEIIKAQWVSARESFLFIFLYFLIK